MCGEAAVADRTVKGRSAERVTVLEASAGSERRPKRRREGAAVGGGTTSHRNERKAVGDSGSLEVRMMVSDWGPVWPARAKSARRGAESPGGMGWKKGRRRMAEDDARALRISRGSWPALRRRKSWEREVDGGMGPASNEGASQTRRGAESAEAERGETKRRRPAEKRRIAFMGWKDAEQGGGWQGKSGLAGLGRAGCVVEGVRIFKYENIILFSLKLIK
jgi:hypothetical protein